MSEHNTELSRDMGLTSALAIGVGTMVAAGIFTLSGLAVRNVGSAAIAAFLLAAVVATFTALTYCEFASIYPRSGEGYLYARKTFPAPLAWLVGWCLLLGYTSSCGFYIASLSTYFQEFVWHSPWPAFSGLVSLVALTLLNIKGTKESGTFQIVVTIGKVLLLLWFVWGGLGAVDMDAVVDKFSTDLVQIGSTGAMVFITFFGFSAIAASAGEVTNPVKTIPRAIFISMAIVTVLYTLVVLTIVAAGLTEYTEAAMGTAAKQFLGPIGGLVIVGGALFSMISASNASIMAGSRVAMSMSLLGHLPSEIGTVNKSTRTPIVALLLAGSTIGAFTLALPLESLAHYADAVLLLALILVNAALIVHRRKYPDIERPFRVPFVPVLPGLGIVANLYLLSQLAHHPMPVILAVASLAVGILGFFAWKGSRPVTLPGAPSKVVLERNAPIDDTYTVLVPVAHPDRVNGLIDLAAKLAKENNGAILALRVVVVPEQSPPRLDDALLEGEAAVLELARARAEQHGVPIHTSVRVGHNISRGILDTATERGCDLIVLGWKGFSSTTQRILGETTDTVVEHAPCDLILIKQVGDCSYERIMVPTAGGPHARLAEEVANSLGGQVTLSTVVPTNAQAARIQSAEEVLSDADSRITADTEKRLLHGDDVVATIVDQAKGHDALLIGAAGEKLYRRLLFGAIPEEVARRTDCTVLVLKKYEPVKAALQKVMAS